MCVCCVFRPLGGYWSEKGCELMRQYEKSQYRYVECRCMHLSTFALLMDMSSEDVRLNTFELELLAHILYSLCENVHGELNLHHCLLYFQ